MNTLGLRVETTSIALIGPVTMDITTTMSMSINSQVLTMEICT